MLCASRSLRRRAKRSPWKKSSAPKLCKPEQHVEASEVSWQCDAIFHTLINTCVENLISQKYFLSSSAQRLPYATSLILTGPFPDVTVAHRIS
jgi:hypothetical protein